MAAAVLVTRLALQGELRIDALGFICAGLNVIMYASPLSAMVIHFNHHLCIFLHDIHSDFCFILFS